MTDRLRGDFGANGSHDSWKQVVLSYGEEGRGNDGSGPARALAFHVVRMWNRPILDVDIVSHCDLNCRSCCHFSPVADPRFLSPDEYERDLGLLAGIEGGDSFFGTVSLMGGEPLLHPDVAAFVRITRELLPQTQVRVCSNGLSVRSAPDGLWDAMRQAQAYFLLTPYPVGIDYQGLVEYIGRRGVGAYLSGMLAKSDDGTPYFLSTPLDERGCHDGTQSFVACPFAGTSLQLRDGRLYPCNRGALLEVLDARFGTSFAYEDGDYLDLASLRDVSQLSAFRTTPKPMCRYCAHEKTVRVRWERSTGRPDEWLVRESD